MLEQVAFAASERYEGRGVEPALDRLGTHPVRIEIPVERRADLLRGEVVNALVEPLLPFDQEQEPDEFHAEPLVVVDHEMVGDGHEI